MKKLTRPTSAENRKIDSGIAADPDTFEATLAQFKMARRGRPALPMQQRKLRITIMLDREIVEKFRAKGRGWQTRINMALRKIAG